MCQPPLDSSSAPRGKPGRRPATGGSPGGQPRDKPMKHERLMGIAGMFMRAPLLALCVCATAALAYGIHWPPPTIRHNGRAPFDLVGSPASRTVLAGGVVRYTIAIHRL